jgi:anaerobic ribonucleoside-triphosphate reductase
MVYTYGKMHIDLLLFYNTLHDYIDNMGEGKTIEDALVESDCLKLYGNNLSSVLSHSILTQSAKFQPYLNERSSRRQGNKINVALEFKDALDLPSAGVSRTSSESGRLLIDFYFEADIEYGEGNLEYVKSLSLEKAVGSIYRLRNANRLFEIDINAQYDFSVEIRKVLNRIQNPRNFLSSDRPNINPQEKAQSFIQSIVRQIKPDTLIEIESPKYDALTGATRGIWLIVTEGIGINYFSIDDRKTGIISSSGNDQMRGSACMGAIEILYVKGEKPDNRNLYEYKDNVYYISAGGSDCINFMFPDQATELDVAQGHAKKVGQLIQRKFTEKLRGYNIDPLGTVAVGALTSGRRLGEGPPKSLARLREVHMPVHNTSADLFRYGIEFVPKENIIRRGDGSMLELDDVTPLFRFFTTGYKNKEIEEKLKDIVEQRIRGDKERITFIFDELNIKIKDDSKAEITRAGEALQYSNIYPSLFAAISVHLSDENSSKITVLEDVKDIVKQFKDVIREKILKASLGADYSGEVDSDDYEEYMSDTLNQTRRRGGRR